MFLVHLYKQKKNLEQVKRNSTLDHSNREA